MRSFGWSAAFQHDRFRRGGRLYLYREHNDGSMEVLGGVLTSTLVPAEVSAGEDAGLWLPDGCYEAIVEAADPPAHGAELRRIEDTLTVERGRVDRMLGSFLGGAS